MDVSELISIAIPLQPIVRLCSVLSHSPSII